MRHPIASLCAAALLLLPAAARAIDPFEIQVYEGEIDEAGHGGLELHTNFVPQDASVPEMGVTAGNENLLRLTLEPSYGLTRWWELGAYLQFAVDGERGAARWGGFKLRTKFIVPRERTGAFVVGLNIEVGRGGAAFGDTDWGNEVRPILAWHGERWSVALNPTVGWTLSGEDRALAPDLDPGAKVRWNTGLGFGIGAEYYAGFGRLTDVPATEEQQHILFGVVDLMDAAFDLNAGVGRGLTDASNDWTFKVILGRGF